jgi:hypothetical protein
MARSRVGIYDPATAAIIDYKAVIANTYQSCGIVFIPSQVGIGIGALDVFVQQSPQNYGTIMSANIRQGITTMRKNGYGVAGYIYGDVQV